ncbi:MAG: TIGR01777 family oxidoreductase [Acidobacteriota bacterium]|nr:TIGR01777 family oxidoreductase [Acidobacteriota bacterium]
MKCIISGGSGFIGSRLVDSLLKDGHYVSVWSRKPGIERRNAVGSFCWDPISGEPASESLEDFDVVVHLAGEPVAQRWTADVKRRIRDSRVHGTRHLVHALSTVKRRPGLLICASAIGYYGDRGDEVLTESSKPGKGFLPEVCVEWEKQADLAESLGLRVVKLRIGVVLGKGGGALEKMVPAFEKFAGGTLASGKQWMSWIHLDDLVAMMRFAMDQPVSGAWNGTAPNPVTNAKFTEALGQALHKPAFLKVPAFALKALYGEMASVMLASDRVLPKAAEAGGFHFQYPELGTALKEIFSKGTV